MKEFEQKKAAKDFVKRWQGKGYEKGESQKFWIDLISNVYGVEMPTTYMEFEVQIKLENISFIDVYIPSTKVIIEQKSMGKDLHKAIKQSDGTFLTPMQQMIRYANAMNYSAMPRWGISCNFQEFMIFDFDNKHGEPEILKLENLPNELHRLDFLISKENIRTKKEVEVSIAAGAIVGKIYDALRKNYKEETEETLKSLNILCVRLIFCLYAEDAGIFSNDQFYHYMKSFNLSHFRRALIDLFKTLDTPINERDEYMEDILNDFPYVNGGLFAGDIKIPNIDTETAELILEEASIGFDWQHISPTIFGAVFESTLSTKLRRAGGMHYTSIENIHKVIDPLFLDELNKEFDSIMEIKQTKSRKNLLEQFQNKIAGLTFLDPACGSGNFLTETFISLRKLENKILLALYTESASAMLDFGEEFTPIKVNIHQFYGIEINDFAVSVAKTALWIAEYQMLQETQSIVNRSIDFLPLKSYSNIVEGNALRIDWKDVIAPEKLSYAIGNPPFLGYSFQSKEQKKDILNIYVDEKGKSYKIAGKIDYVAGWYFKMAEYMQNTNVKCSFVSTNSIVQGEQVTGVWKPLYDRFNIHIDFAWRTFKWENESSTQAAVHVVIVGFSSTSNSNNNKLYISTDMVKYCKNINPYLMDAPTVFIENYSNSLCNAPLMMSGNRPTDDGNLIIENDEYYSFIKANPLISKYVKPLIGAKEFINNIPRYCLWLLYANPKDINNSPDVLKRISNVREFRLKSTKVGTRQKADTPTLFDEIRDIQDDYIALPITSSSNRKYIPIGFINKNIIPTNSLNIIIGADLYHFGILTSNIFMLWVESFGGRMKSDYRITKNNLYNPFPWPSTTAKQKEKIKTTAQAILEARAVYTNNSFADLYNDLTMPPELRKAHQQNDAAVMEAYGFTTTPTPEHPSKWLSPSETVAELMKMYQKLTEK